MYRCKRIPRDILILRECWELAHYLLIETARSDLIAPKPVLERSDTSALREKILSLSGSDARTLRPGKSTIYCLRKRASPAGDPTRKKEVSGGDGMSNMW